MHVASDYRSMDQVGPFFAQGSWAVQVAIPARNRDGTSVPFGMDAFMASVIWDTQTWAERTFGTCVLGDRRRNERLMKLAVQAVARPDGSLPDQTELWGDCKAAYRLFNCDKISFQDIISPHCQLTRESCLEGETKLIICDTTEVDFANLSKATGLGPIGNGSRRGFFLHTGLMIDDDTHRIEGLAGQKVFYRTVRTGKPTKKHRRRKEERESAVWGQVIDQVGAPPKGVTWIHVCDRGADDIEVMWKALNNQCGFLIRAARLHRKVMTLDGRVISLTECLSECEDHGQRKIEVLANATSPARTATVTLHYTNVDLPLPKVVTPWLKATLPTRPLLRVGVVELREVNPPKGCTPIRWVLYSHSPVNNKREADKVIERYEQRPIVEDYHKALKTGCAVQKRQLQAADRLERIVALDSIVAVRLLQMKTAAHETPDRPAHELVPKRWIQLLQIVRNLPCDPGMTIYQFVRQLAGLGGFLLRKSDGEPGWITIWRGFEKLQLIIRGADAERKKCG